MSVLVSFSIFPLDKGESVSPYVARAGKIIEKSGLPHVLTPMETVIERENLEEVLEVVKDCFKELEKDCNRIIITLKLDYRKGKTGRIKSKVESVKEKLKGL